MGSVWLDLVVYQISISTMSGTGQKVSSGGGDGGDGGGWFCGVESNFSVHLWSMPRTLTLI